MAGHDPQVHRRYLDYRESYVYFARGGPPCMSLDEFTVADTELRALLAKAELDDEEDARRSELETLLFRD
jgi:hypothetical protein